MKIARPSSVLVTLLSVLLVLSAVLNLLLFRLARRSTRQGWALRLDPLDLSAYPPGDLSWDDDGSSRPRIVFFGDSRATQWPAPAGLDGYHFVNRGVNSQTSAQAAARFEQHVTPLRPDIVIVQLGVNDLWMASSFPGQEGAIVEACKANLRRVVAEAAALEATVILATIFPLGRPTLQTRLFWPDSTAPLIEEVNRDLRSLAGENVIILDTAQILAGDGGEVKPEYSLDYLHLNKAGYQALNTELSALLSNLSPPSIR